MTATVFWRSHPALPRIVKQNIPTGTAVITRGITGYSAVGSQLMKTGLCMTWLIVVKKEDFRKANH
jgi:hypothetical protein